DAEPLIEHSGIDPAEVGVVLQVAHRDLLQARMRPHQPRLDLAADQEHRRCRAVVGAFAAVLLGPPAELGERHHQQPVLVPARRLLAWVFEAVRCTKSSRPGLRVPPGFADPSMTSRCAFASVPPATWSWKSCSEAIDGTRAGAPSRASGARSPLFLRWNDGAP